MTRMESPNTSYKQNGEKKYGTRKDNGYSQSYSAIPGGPREEGTLLWVYRDRPILSRWEDSEGRETYEYNDEARTLTNFDKGTMMSSPVRTDIGIIKNRPDPVTWVRPKGKSVENDHQGKAQIKIVTPNNNKSDAQNVNDKLFTNRLIYWVKDSTNEKQASDRSVFIEGECGLEPYNSYREDVTDALSEMGVYSPIKIDHAIRDISHRHMVEEVNVDAKFLIQTKSGEIIDLEELYKIHEEGKDPYKYHTQWKKRYTEYRKHLITLHTGVNYPEDGEWQKGKQALENFLWLAIANNSDRNVMNNAINWIEQFMGRLLIGENIWKEFVVFLGEKDSGKTTFVNFLYDIMGTYAGVIPDSVLMDKDSEPIRKTIFGYRVKRFLIHSEGTNKRKINTQNLKRITGDSLIPIGENNFKISVKIVEDSNYAPVPDIPDDEAFNGRLILIPFTQKPECPQSYVARVISDLYANREAIFAFMVRMSVYSMGEASKLPNRPQISERATWWLKTARDPVSQFYRTVCKTDVPSSVYTSGVEAYDWYNRWVTRILRPKVAGLRFLRNEKIPPLSINEFYSAIQEIHPFSIIPHGRDGKTITQFHILREIILNGVWTALPFQTQMAINDARQSEEIADRLEAADAPRRLEAAVNKSLEDSRKRIFQRTENSRYPMYPEPHDFSSGFMGPPQNMGQTNPWMPPSQGMYPMGGQTFNPFMYGGPYGGQYPVGGPVMNPFWGHTPSMYPFGWYGHGYGNPYMNPMTGPMGFGYPY
jgi:hypothetical protein